MAGRRARGCSRGRRYRRLESRTPPRHAPRGRGAGPARDTRAAPDWWAQPAPHPPAHCWPLRPVQVQRARTMAPRIPGSAVVPGLAWGSGLPGDGVRRRGRLRRRSPGEARAEPRSTPADEYPVPAARRSPAAARVLAASPRCGAAGPAPAREAAAPAPRAPGARHRRAAESTRALAASTLVSAMLISMTSTSASGGVTSSASSQNSSSASPRPESTETTTRVMRRLAWRPPPRSPLPPGAGGPSPQSEGPWWPLDRPGSPHRHRR